MRIMESLPRKIGMTLEDVERFCARARELGVEGETVMQGGVTIGGTLYRLSADTTPK